MNQFAPIAAVLKVAALLQWIGTFVCLSLGAAPNEPAPATFQGQPAQERRLHVDVNGDGKADLVDVYHLGPGLRIHTLLSKGDGTWTEAQDDPWPDYVDNDAATWKVSDVNGDGRADLVSMFLRRPGLRTHVLLSNGKGVWNNAKEDLRHDYQWDDMAKWQVADVNGDKKYDWVNVSVLAPGLRVDCLISQGDGTWKPVHSEPAPSFVGNDTDRWLIADIDANGNEDLVNVGQTNGGFQINALMSYGQGKWILKQQKIERIPFPPSSEWRVADVNGDRKADIVSLLATNGELHMHVLVSAGDGTWDWFHQRFGRVDAETDSQWLAGDFNGDGKDEIGRISCTKSGLCLHSLVSEGDATWTDTVRDVWPGYVPPGILQWKGADVDADGKTDLVEISHRNPGLKIRVLFARENGAWIPKEQNLWDTYGTDDTRNWKVAF